MQNVNQFQFISQPKRFSLKYSKPNKLFNTSITEYNVSKKHVDRYNQKI